MKEVYAVVREIFHPWMREHIDPNYKGEPLKFYRSDLNSDFYCLSTSRFPYTFRGVHLEIVPPKLEDFSELL